ncbi:MAG: SDR family oxidoreductase [Gemmatimonadetes bacterium]|nr:SDR family oxidoreductase [Gemmatimonadota bacterium]
MDLVGRTALVTGGAHRLGGALARALAAAGADVVINYRRSAAAADTLVRELKATGRRALAVPADVADPAAVRALVAAALAEYGRLDVLVNSASRFDRIPFAEITPEQWDRALAVNLKAPFLLAQAAAPALRATRGCIINLLDLSAFQPWAGFVPHAVSKAGLLHLTRCLARVLAPDVRVNAIAPGHVLPPPGFDIQDNGDTLDRRVLDRAGSPADVIGALTYLVDAPFVTGEVLVVDGGRLLL